MKHARRKIGHITGQKYSRDNTLLRLMMQTCWRPKCELSTQHKVVEDRVDSVSLCPYLRSRGLLPVLDNTSPQASEANDGKLGLIDQICMFCLCYQDVPASG